MHAVQNGGKSRGFAHVELLLVVVVLAALAGIGYYVMHRTQANKTTEVSNSSASVPANNSQPNGTTASIDQLTQSDAASEAKADSSADSQSSQDAASTNAAASNVGGAYDESTL